MKIIFDHGECGENNVFYYIKHLYIKNQILAWAETRGLEDYQVWCDSAATYLAFREESSYSLFVMSWHNQKYQIMC